MSRCLMWKKEDSKPAGVSGDPVNSATRSSLAASSSPATVGALPTSPRAAACISQGIRIKGEITGSEDLFVDGIIEGKLNLANGSLTIGPNGHVKADVHAREVIVRGKIEGKVTGRDKVQLWSTGQVTGEVQTDRLAIEDGALLRGKVEAGRQTNKPAEIKASVATPIGKTADRVTVNSGTAAD
ncbi:MAG: cell shape determination protein CcmA [Acidobacteria bacterium]|nr:MAG: cell shape determination protein CcmA [Acidobacteriota bacterium]PYU39998.1 MAG: cell shape determination protein CcmA [Acidobacteriota bacterium]PYU73172.1 MAG: cell shape determination protein CcmA [Acidobacteriota bacterium]